MSITFGPIYNAQNNKIREWSITVSLFTANDRQIPIENDIDMMNIKEEWYASYTTCSGYTGLTMTTSTPTVISIGKNIGRKNETNVLTQAVKDCRSKYAAKIKAGYSESNKVNETKSENKVAFPMAVKSWKDHGEKLEYPLFIQPKLDGIRMIAVWDDGEVKLYTRRLSAITGFTKIKRDLKAMFRKSKRKALTIDGELYSHGMGLQAINSVVRNESIPEEEKETISYHVFDCYDTTDPTLGFEARINILKAFINTTPSELIVLNPTVEINSEEEANEYFNKVVADGYEGVIYKSRNRPYEFSFSKEKRSSWYLKRKKQDDGEYPIVGFTQGKGKDLGCIVFELRTADGHRFNSVPNGTYEYRRALYAKAVDEFSTEFDGKLAKVVFDDLSTDGIPLRGRIVQIDRDLSFD